MPDYKFNEGAILDEVRTYVDSTYFQHYATNDQGSKKVQTTELIISSGHGTGFFIGNILKYADRYGRKGLPAAWREGLMKIIHYAIMAIYNHDLKYGNRQSTLEAPMTAVPQILTEHG